MLLALDSSSDRLLLGIADQGRILADHSGAAERNHSEKLIEELEKLLLAAEITPDQLEQLAVVTGPGSFTGLRVGIATFIGLAKTWQIGILGGTTQALQRLYYDRSRQEAITVIHCRADRFFVSEDGSLIRTMPGDEIQVEFKDRLFGGPGVSRLNQLLTGGGRPAVRVIDPITYSGGELALLFAENHNAFEPLDPSDLQINYAAVSQPERLRDKNREKLILTEMRQRDLDDIVRIEQDSFTDAWQRGSFVHDLASKWVITLVARKGGHCIGYAHCIAIDDYGYLSNIAVAGESRSQGIGKSLLDEVCRRLKRLGKTQLLLDVRPSNRRAIMFYEQYGFSLLTRRHDFYTNPVEDSYTMGLDLTD